MSGCPPCALLAPVEGFVVVLFSRGRSGRRRSSAPRGDLRGAVRWSVAIVLGGVVRTLVSPVPGFTTFVAIPGLQIAFDIRLDEC